MEETLEEGMMVPEVTMEMILSTFATKREEKKLKDIKNAVAALICTDTADLFDTQREEVEKQVEELVKADKKAGAESFLNFSKGKYTKRSSKMPPGGIVLPKEFAGKAGECAVMSELLFRGFNVNQMMVDGGIDLVGFHEGLYYFYQVKTVSVKNGVINAGIPLDNYDKDRGYASQMRYVIVARYKGADAIERNQFFVFSHEDLDRLMHERCVKRGAQYITVKIRFHERSGKPVLYDERECDASWYCNKFERRPDNGGA